jgi:hypothetical protein
MIVQLFGNGQSESDDTDVLLWSVLKFILKSNVQQ